MPELLDELVDRLGPQLRALGSEALVEPLSTLDQAGEQLAIGRGDGGGAYFLSVHRQKSMLWALLETTQLRSTC